MLCLRCGTRCRQASRSTRKPKAAPSEPTKPFGEVPALSRCARRVGLSVLPGRRGHARRCAGVRRGCSPSFELAEQVRDGLIDEYFPRLDGMEQFIGGNAAEYVAFLGRVEHKEADVIDLARRIRGARPTSCGCNNGSIAPLSVPVSRERGRGAGGRRSRHGGSRGHRRRDARARRVRSPRPPRPGAPAAGVHPTTAASLGVCVKGQPRRHSRSCSRRSLLTARNPPF